MAGSIMFIDQDRTAVHEMQLALMQEGYVTCHAAPGLEALRMVLTERPALVILSVGTEERDWSFCRHLLTFLDCPLLLLLSVGSDLERVRGLEFGADDCLARPVMIAELVARVRALLRRENKASRLTKSYFADGDLVVDLTRAEVRLHGEPVPLTPIELRFLHCFVRHVGETLAPERLAIQVWGADYPGSRDAIKQYIYQLRHKLEANPGHPRRILTRRGRGYVFLSLADP